MSEIRTFQVDNCAHTRPKSKSFLRPPALSRLAFMAADNIDENAKKEGNTAISERHRVMHRKTTYALKLKEL